MSKHRTKIPFHSRTDVPTRAYMRCPKCGNMDNFGTVQITSGACKIGPFKGIGRERSCKECYHAWRTLELNDESIDMLITLIGGVTRPGRGKGKEKAA